MGDYLRQKLSKNKYKIHLINIFKNIKMKQFYLIIPVLFIPFLAFGQNVGVGTTTPKNTLDVEGGMTVGAAYSGTETAPTNGMLIEGNVAIGKTTATEELDVNGRIAAKGYKNTILTAEGTSMITMSAVNTWTDVTDLSLTFTLDEPTTVIPSFSMSLQNNSGGYLATLRIDIDGTGYSPTLHKFDGGEFHTLTNQHTAELAAGSHTIKIQYYIFASGPYQNTPNEFQERKLQVLIFGAN